MDSKEPNSELFKHLKKILDVLNIPGLILNDMSIETLNSVLQNLLLSYLSKYKYKTQKSNPYLNQILIEGLKNLNSLYLICRIEDLNSFLYFFIYFFFEFEFLNDYLDKINRKLKKITIIRLDNILDYVQVLNEKQIKLNEIEKGKSNLSPSFNRINMNLKNIKKQIDNFINLSFKLNKVIVNDNNPLFKIEECLLFSNDNLFDMYKSTATEAFSSFELLINKINSCVDLVPRLIELSTKNLRNFNVPETYMNPDYVKNLKKIESKKAKKIFLANLKLEGNEDIEILKQFIDDFEEKLKKQMSILKENSSIIESLQIKDFLSDFASRLDDYFEKNLRSIYDFNFSPELLSQVYSFIEDNKNKVKNDINIHENTQNYIEKKYKYIVDKYDTLNTLITEKLSLNYDTFNI